MKTNIPEKIYVTECMLFATNPEITLPKNDSIEYIQTDVVIEKFVKWLRESVTNNPECNRVLSKKGVITIGGLIEDLREYMKGE